MAFLTALEINDKTFGSLLDRIQPLLKVAPPENHLGRIDPYILWVSLTGNQTIAPLRQDAQSRQFSVFLELENPATFDPSRIPGQYLTLVRQTAPATERLMFVSALIRVPLGDRLKREIPELATLLPEAVGIRRILLTAPSTSPSDAKAAPKDVPYVGNFDEGLTERLEPLLGALTAPLARSGKEARLPSQERRAKGRRRSAPGVLVGIVDDGFGLASLRRQGATGHRFRALWDQGMREDPPAESSEEVGYTISKNMEAVGQSAWRAFWKVRTSAALVAHSATAPTESKLLFSYGFELDPEYLDQSLRDVSEGCAELQALRDSRYLFPTPRWTHGSAMADLILRRDSAPRMCSDGRGGWRMRRPLKLGPRLSYSLVQLPRATVRDTSGASLAPFAYDAILYILDNAEEGEQVVVNLSYGTFGGPHDGSSMFERAIVDLLKRFNGTVTEQDPMGRTLHVVVPAGNSHLQRTHFGAILSRDRRCASMYWSVLPDDDTDSFLEVWVPRGAKMKVTVTPPAGLERATVTPGNQKAWVADGTVHAGVFFPLEVPDSVDRTMALIAVARTRSALPRPRPVPDDPAAPPDLLGPHGIWQIDVELSTEDERGVRVDAWIQRDDAAPGQVPRRGRPSNRQSRFLDLPTDGVAGVFPECTLNGIGTVSHERFYVVGAMRGDNGTISEYSSAGPSAHPAGQRVDGPDATAVADASPNLPGLLTGGVLSSTRTRISGTSGAAAQFSRALASHLACGGGAATFVWAAPELPSYEKPVPAGAPTRALAIHRGECTRMPLDLNED